MTSHWWWSKLSLAAWSAEFRVFRKLTVNIVIRLLSFTSTLESWSPVIWWICEFILVCYWIWLPGSLCPSSMSIRCFHTHKSAFHTLTKRTPSTLELFQLDINISILFHLPLDVFSLIVDCDPIVCTFVLELDLPIRKCMQIAYPQINFDFMTLPIALYKLHKNILQYVCHQIPI